MEKTLYNKPGIVESEEIDYDIRIFDNLVEMHDANKKKNSESKNPSRMLSGDVFPWISMNDKAAIDINIENFHAQWNRKNLLR